RCGLFPARRLQDTVFDEHRKWVECRQPVLLSQLNNHLKVGEVFNFVSCLDPIDTNLRKGGKYAAILSLVYRVVEWGTNKGEPPPPTKRGHISFPCISVSSRVEDPQLG